MIVGDIMSYFKTFYLDKEKDIVVHLDMNEDILSYTIFVRERIDEDAEIAEYKDGNLG